MAYEDPRHESLTATLGKIVDDVRELFREEVALARAEVRQEISGFTSLAIWFGAAAVAAAFSLSFLLLGIAQAFAILVGWPIWAGYATMAVLLGIVAFAAIQAGRRRARTVSAVPHQTVESLKETKEWIQHRMTSARE
jgi:uncharacterized membrane protein YqjE